MKCSWPRRAALTAIVTTFMLGACAGTSWTKAGATSEELERDRRVCVRYARGIGQAEAARAGMERLSRRATNAALRRCMEARGWVEDSGSHAATAGRNAATAGRNAATAGRNAATTG